jgi:hypothetical protein
MLHDLPTPKIDLGCEDPANESQTLEVAFARVYNWDVAQRRKEREGGESIEDKKAGSPNG